MKEENLLGNYIKEAFAKVYGLQKPYITSEQERKNF